MLYTPSWSTKWVSRLLPAREIKTHLGAWRELSQASLEDNVYYTPAYSLALIETCEKSEELAFATAWRGDVLVGLLPVTYPSAYLPYPLPIGRAWASKYTFSCTPLLHFQYADMAAVELLGLLDSIYRGDWTIPLLNFNGPCFSIFTGIFEQQRIPWRALNRFKRATLNPSSPFEEHMRNAVAVKRRKELARTRRRLQEKGELKHEVYCSGDGLKRAINDFLRIEASGWKGEQGTALACSEETRDFALRAFSAPEDLRCRADLLRFRGDPIAVGITLFGGDTAFSVKCTYDEKFRSYSPGLLLEEDVLKSFLTERWASRIDGATAGEHVVDGLWAGHVEVADLAFSMAKHLPGFRVQALATANDCRSKGKAVAKAALSRLASPRPRGSTQDLVNAI